MPKTARYLGFAFANSDLLLEVGEGGEIGFLAGAVQALTGQDQAALMGQPLRSLLSDADGRLVSRLLATLGENERLEPRVVQVRHPDLGEVPCLVGAYKVAGRANVCVTFARLPAREMRAGGAAPGLDVETGLSNRDGFQRFVAAADGRDDQARRLTLVRLAQLPELRAHLVPERASELMAEIGAVLRQHAPTDAAVARLGIDRFGIMHGADLLEVVRAEVDTVVRALVPGIEGDVVDVQTLDTQGLGLSQPDRVRVLLHVIRRFAEDERCNLDLGAGRALIPTIVQDTVSRMVGLREDLASQGIHLVYQPIVDLRTGRSHHLEALARRRDGSSYAAGVMFAEQMGMAGEFDLFICRSAISDIEKAQDKCKVAVNLSGHSIESDLFVEMLLNLLRSVPKVRKQILFELTETVGLRDIERAARVITELRGIGHPVCLDDFGAGAASFPYLRDLKFDFVKLDGSYVRNLGRSERDDAILGSMMGLCRRLKVATIAEHVETVEQVVRLRNLKCEFAQGWMFGRGTEKIEHYQFDLTKLNSPSLWHTPLRSC